MAVYKQEYTPYEGPMRGDRWRFAILTRYSFLAVFDSRLLVTFFALCFIPPLLACGILYANHNAKNSQERAQLIATQRVDRHLKVLIKRTGYNPHIFNPPSKLRLDRGVRP